MNIKFPLKHNELPISAAHANEWKATLIERLSTMGASVYERLEISAEEKHLVFWSEKGLLWALMYLPPAALTASERAAWAIALIPDNPERLLSAMDALADKLQSFAAMASKIRPNKSEIKGRVTDYVSPEAAAMYRAINISCASSKYPHRRHMCKEWCDDYKAFERYFLENNVADKEGIIAHVVYGPGTVMFVSKFVQSFYNRTKRDFSAKLEELRVMGTITEEEHLFMKKKGAFAGRTPKGAGKMIIDPVASNLAAVLKRIKAGDRQEEQAICGNVAIMSHCSAAKDLLRRKMGQWADTKNKESPSYRRRTAVFPIHNLARDMDNGTIWKNKERLMLLDWLIDQLTMPDRKGPIGYYGYRQRNYATRQQKTKRLLKQAGISYSFNVLQDMKEAGVSYTRRNIVKDAFERLGVF